MSGLSRRGAAPTVRHVHLGLGNFFRAHQAWYTSRAPDATQWGIAAFTGRTPGLVDALTAQDGLYTLVTRSGDGDGFEVVDSIARVFPASDHAAWLGYLKDPRVRVVTMTVTEAGYLRGADGGLDVDRPEVRADVDALRTAPSSPVRTAPAKLVAGLAARCRADAGPLTLVPCDNLPGNGAVTARIVREFAQFVDPGLPGRLEESVSYVTTVVDRITPRPIAADVAAVGAATGADDHAPVVTEPFTEWVLSGDFAAGRPQWEDAGAAFVHDIGPFEERKLWLLNGAHSLLAYTASLRGHVTVSDAMTDETCRAWLEQWWNEASRHLNLPDTDIAAYRAALIDRFANPRMRHRLDQIATDGSQKLPVRLLPVLRLERAAGRVPLGTTRALAAWVCHLRGSGGSVNDVRSADIGPLTAGPLTDAVRTVLGALDPALAADSAVVNAVTVQACEIAPR
ncbi:fructuronate reductase [Spinactinospora alkalitolerans]|uniref:Fructuronate reductase n=1 Tax=Spinactinospora alkalitolerans TaxID=687207 RepID=A0A852TYR4_9ACTN|nr:mannitol dehydrogenase family protein [Spinactinospora alkalitolerans]NYE47933.1 fructuronate reductase [Spinactinospora alkalitolerans]